jgi:D-3-phosphoglycerate dehydrogenase
MMLSLARDLPQLHRNMRAGYGKSRATWAGNFADALVGIVGYGQIGRRTAKLAAAFGAKIVIYSRSRVNDPDGAEVEDNFDRLLGKVDILSLHCPLTDKTRGMIGERTLGLMKPDAILINTGRGGLVDEAALADALRSGRLAGAGLDVFAQEPADPKNPLFQLDNVICTPHVAALTAEAMVRMGTAAANNIIGYLQGGSWDRQSLVNSAVLKSA